MRKTMTQTIRGHNPKVTTVTVVLVVLLLLLTLVVVARRRPDRPLHTRFRAEGLQRSSVWGMRDSFLGSIMIGVGRATSSRGQSARVAYFLGFLGNSRPGTTENQML